MPPIRPPDDRRLEALLERYARLLGSTVRRLCPRDLGIDTQDVEQEARLRLWRALERAAEGEPNPSYVHKVAASAAIDAIRAATARRDRIGPAATGTAAPDADPAAIDPPEPAGRSPEDRFRHRQLATAIEAAVSALPSARQRAVRLHLWGFSSPEISRLTGWSETKARSLISRGLAELRRRLGEKGVADDAGV